MQAVPQSTDVSAAEMVQRVLVGLLGGLTATWAMTQFQLLLSPRQDQSGEQEAKHSQEPQEEGSSTMRVGDAISKLVRGRPVSDEHKELAGQVVHYAYGTLMGGLYGAIKEVFPQTAAGRGTAWGTLLWLGGDEIALPLLRLAGPPTQYAVSTHAAAWAAHLVYGLTLDTVCRSVEQLACSLKAGASRRAEEPQRDAPRLDYAELIAAGR
ncbi:MAG TPA: DUF1440 domain-containing protein [Phycisphaerae bacterium]|nr:DUF1440 domain-containing protein [Phycisphaerae bacterium]HOM49992.1 DUF1440 domain-containing protein [Phycisphaerae bacterium]HOQ84760.1 DUF1440 domain-containing protein [Phycisphaerae bacterium]HPP26420.1 DUF1440 domain-containing protein [Phycisphaerae bacterium]HPU26290.1 DUF1440 domain-containing protein [Phycisphaerae bacterium]